MPQTPPLRDWLPPETPEEKAALDNFAAVCARIIWPKATNPLPEYKPGEASPRGDKRSNKR